MNPGPEFTKYVKFKIKIRLKSKMKLFWTISHYNIRFYWL